MFKGDSDSEDEGILSKAYAKYTEKTEKGIDPNASCTSETVDDTINLTQDSTGVINSALDEFITCDRVSEPVVEVQTTSLRRSPRIKKNAPLNLSIDDDVDFLTSRRRRSTRRVIYPEGSDGNVPVRKGRKKRGKKPNPNVICIGSDDEENYGSHVITSKSKVKANTRLKSNKNSSDQLDSILLVSDDEGGSSKRDSLNEIVNVKIEWMCEGGLIIQLGKTEPFSKIYEELSRTKGHDVNKIVLCKKKDGKVVKPHETPLSIKLSIIDILEGSISSKAIENPEKDVDSDSESSNKNLLNFRILVEGQKAPSFVKIEKHQTMHVLLTKLAGKLQCSVDKMKLWFDGEPLKHQDTPDTLDLEGDECLELKFKKN